MQDVLTIIGGIVLVILLIGAFLQNEEFGRFNVTSNFLSSWMENQRLRKYTIVMVTYGLLYITYVAGISIWSSEPVLTGVVALFYVFIFFGAFRKDTRNTRN